MAAYAVRRSLRSLAVAVVTVLTVFCLSRITGDPSVLYLPLESPEHLRQAFRETHGFNRPIAEQLVSYVWGAARGDLGESVWQHRPAMSLVLERTPATLLLALLAMLIACLTGWVGGALAAGLEGSWIDKLITTLSLAGLSVPGFWLALMMVWLLAVKWRLFPTSGTSGVSSLVMPIATLAWPHAARLTQVTRAALLEELGAPYLLAARAKGLKQRGVFIHAARNALTAFISVAGRDFVGLANGAVVVEAVFGWPGVGKLLMDAIHMRDFAVVQAAVLWTALLVAVLNLGLDFVYVLVDPRIRFN